MHRAGQRCFELSKQKKSYFEAKILGIRFSLIFSTLKQNWSRLTGIIKGIADSHKHRNLSMHGKLLLIKTLPASYHFYGKSFSVSKKNTNINLEDSSQVSVVTVLF